MKHSKMNIVIYSKDNCPNCNKAKNILSKFNPKILLLGKDISREDFFKKFPTAKQVPQIIINQNHIGGYPELEKWMGQNSFNEEF